VNILIEELPDSVEIDDVEYSLNVDFRSCLRTILAFEDYELTTQEKYQIMISNLYQEVPTNLTKAVALGIKFLNGGEESKDEDGGNSPRLYSFSQDAGYIFSAFQQTHGIDLESTPVHWWKFLALFMDLGSETTFCSLIGLRKRIKNGTATKEEKRAYREMKEIVDIPDYKSPDMQARETEFLQLVARGREK
jgi:hypothetical protein